MDALGSFFGGTPARTIDTRSPEQLTQERGRADTSAMLQQDYARAINDPAYAMMSPEQARTVEQDLTSSVLGRVGAAGGAGSAYGRSLAAKALVDFRLKQLQDQFAARSNLRNALIASQGAQGQPGQIQAPQAGVGRMAGERIAGGIADRAGTSASDAIFGPQQQPAGGMRVSAPSPGGAEQVPTDRIMGT